jgi:hypothetical protein
MQSQHT